MQCKKIKSDGNNCNAYAMTGFEYCYLHNPKVPGDEKKSIQAKGGSAQLSRIEEPLDALSIKQPKDVVRLLEDTINQVRAGVIDVKVANCIGVLSGQLIKAMEITQIKSKVEIIERAILERKTTIS
jgi:hypothetical protein